MKTKPGDKAQGEAYETKAHAPDRYSGLGGSYTRDPETGARTPTQETKDFHETKGKVSNEQEEP